VEQIRIGSSAVDAYVADETAFGCSWVVREAMSRTSHALVDAGRVWLVDPVEWEPGLERALALGRPAAVLQLLDRHNRDCAALARRLGVPHLVAPDAVPDSPFEAVPLVRSRWWRETALWWPERRALVVAEAVGTTAFATAGKAPVGVHLLLRLTPPRSLARYEPEHLLVGHGPGLHGDATPAALRQALRTSRRGLPGLLVRLPFADRER
jgi:hypothetical protein